jgi:hypothetical protein
MILHYRRFRPNLGLLPRILLAAAIACVMILATVGAVVGALLLAVGALVHWVVRRLRPLPATPAAAGPTGVHVYEGEFRVVQPEPATPRALPEP